MFREFRAKIEHQKKEGLPYAFLMMSLSIAVKQQLGNGFMIPCRAFGLMQEKNHCKLCSFYMVL